MIQLLFFRRIAQTIVQVHRNQTHWKQLLNEKKKKRWIEMMWICYADWVFCVFEAYDDGEKKQIPR